MRKVLCILLLAWPLLIKAQDACLPDYGFPVKKITVKNHMLAYVEEGKGKTLLLLHGLGGNISHWTKNIKPLAKSFHVIAVDLPGYGYSQKNIDRTTDDLLGSYAEVVLELIKKKGLKNVTLAGHSMGGQVAIITALRDAGNITRLVLVSPAGLESFTPQEAQLLTGSTPASVFENQDEAAIRASFKRNFYGPAPEKLIQERLKFKTCGDFGGYAIAVSRGVKGMLNHPVKNELKNIHQPVLIVYGQQDALIPNKYLHPLLTLDDVVKTGTDNIPKSKAVLINNAGHIVQYERPDELNKALVDFLNK